MLSKRLSAQELWRGCHIPPNSEEASKSQDHTAPCLHPSELKHSLQLTASKETGPLGVQLQGTRLWQQLKCIGSTFFSEPLSRVQSTNPLILAF